MKSKAAYRDDTAQHLTCHLSVTRGSLWALSPGLKFQVTIIHGPNTKSDMKNKEYTSTELDVVL